MRWSGGCGGVLGGRLSAKVEGDFLGLGGWWIALAVFLCGGWDRGSFGLWNFLGGVFCDVEVLLLERRGFGWDDVIVDTRLLSTDVHFQVFASLYGKSLF